MYLEKVVGLLTAARALGPAAHIRDGFAPLSKELDFLTTDMATVNAVVSRARDQAPYANIQVVPDSGRGGVVTVFVQTDLLKLANFLTEHVLMQGIGRTWATASGALPTLIRRSIDETVGAGEAWDSLINRLHAQSASLIEYLQALESGQPGPVAAVVREAAQETVGQEASWSAFVHRLRSQVDMLGLIIRAVETGQYLLE